MEKYHSIFLLTGVTLFLSCQKVIEPKDLPEQDPRIVVNCILNTDENIHANISMSKSILSGKDYKYINNAICELYEDGVYIQNLVFTSNGDYAAPVFPKNNKQYTLKVSATGFESVNATTLIPPTFSAKPLETYDTVSSYYSRSRYGSGGESYINGETKYRVRLIDEPNVKNHYSIVPWVVLLDSLDQPLNYSVSITVVDYTSSRILGGETYYSGSIDIDDKTVVNGQEIVANIGVQIYVNENSNTKPVKNVQVFLQFQSVSEDYYKYKQTLLNQATMGVNLFAEPVLVYNNINNGMGILAGMTTTFVPAYSGKIRGN